MTPPTVPSHVFFGEIFVSGVLPIKDPTMYAIVSLIQMLATIITTYIFPKKSPKNSLSNLLLKLVSNAQLKEIYSKPRIE